MIKWKQKYVQNVELKNSFLNIIKMDLTGLVNSNTEVIVKIVPTREKPKDIGKKELMLMPKELNVLNAVILELMY